MLLKAVALASAAALACASSTDVFAIRDLPGPNIGTPMQQRIERKLEAYDSDPTTYNELWDDARDFLLLVCTDEELSYAKNRYVAGDHNVGDMGAGSRSAAVLSMNACHHIVRGVCTDRFRSDKARRACELAIKIMGSVTAKAGQVVPYPWRLERLLSVCTTYLIIGGKDEHGEDSLEWTQITRALSLFALCGYAAFNAFVRGARWLASSREKLQKHLEGTARQKRRPVHRLLSGACPGEAGQGQTKACFLVIGTYGASRKVEKIVPCLSGTVFEASRSDLCIGFWLPFNTVMLAWRRWRWGNQIHYSLASHLFGGDGGESSTWYGCNFLYVRLQSVDYEALKGHLKGPHYCLDLEDPAVLELISQAYERGEAAGHEEFLATLFDGPSHYYCEKTWQ